MYNADQIDALLDKAAKNLAEKGAMSQEDIAKKLAQLREPEAFETLRMIASILDDK